MCMKTPNRCVLVPEDRKSEIPVLDAETQARWDTWCDARIHKIVDVVVRIVGEETGLQDRKLRNQITKLRAELAILRTDVRKAIGHLPGSDLRAARRGSTRQTRR